MSTNTHVQASTCRKDVRGRPLCHLARPVGVFEEETQPLRIKLNRSSNPSKRSRADFTVRSIDDDIAACVDKAPDYKTNDRCVSRQRE